MIVFVVDVNWCFINVVILMCVNAHPSYQNRTIIGICYFFLNNIFPGLLFILVSLILLVRVYAKKKQRLNHENVENYRLNWYLSFHWTFSLSLKWKSICWLCMLKRVECLINVNYKWQWMKMFWLMKKRIDVIFVLNKKIKETWRKTTFLYNKLI